MNSIRQTSLFISLLVVLGFILVVPSISFAYQHTTQHTTVAATPGHVAVPGRTTSPTTPAAKGPAEIYSVVSIGDNIEVKSKTELKNLQKQLDDDYKQALKKYQDAKKDKNNHDANTLKMPAKKDYTLKILKAPFKTQEDAQKFADDKIKEQKGNGNKTGAKW